MKKILLFGSHTYKKDATKTGGVVILFELLLKELRNRNIEYGTVDTLIENHGNKVNAFVYSCFNALIKIPKYDFIALQGTINSIVYLGPLVIIWSKLFSKQVSVRVFAGNLKDVYLESNFIKKSLIRFVLNKSDVNFFETKYLIEYFHEFNQNTYWFPNVREPIKTIISSKKYSKRFVYIGTINEEKGVDVLVNAVSKLSSEYIVDIYGPIIEDKYSQEYFVEHGVNYKGALKSEDVLDTMHQYDVLILPSFREGYPGVIIEAFMLGIPVIATKLEGIMEMVTHKENGLLVACGDEEELIKMISFVTEENYQYYSKHALASFSDYSSEERSTFFLEKIGYYDQ